MANQEDLGRILTAEQGKPYAEGKGEIAYGASFVEWFSEEAKRVNGETLPTFDNNRRLLVLKQPIGVCAAITPWNFPLAMITRKVAPALAAGCPVIIKPAELTPLTALAAAELALRAGIPAGVLNVLPGFGHTVGKALALHMDVDTLVFTGSTKIAKQLMIYAGESNMKRVWLEAGGKSANIVFEDAPCLKEAAEAAAMAICFNQGEMCTAGSRLLVQRSIKDKFMPMVVEALKGWKVGHALDPETQVGALVDQGHLNSVLSYIEAGHADQAKMLCGGKRTLEETGGVYVEPTIFDDAHNKMRIAQEEIFGPVLTVIPFDTTEEAIAIANDSIYGLAAAIWTSNLSKAHLAAKALRVGSMWVNQYDGGDMTAPFGGYKQSGNGRDKSLHAFDKYTEIKATWIKL
jgi:4-guanidinobutyraldehyde dehydrogenase / NAD-dependent aldehyde dehydrogenase